VRCDYPHRGITPFGMMLESHTIMPPKPRLWQDRFMEKIQIAEDGCWDWTAGTNGNGYGVFWLVPNRTRVYAHRLMHEWMIGPIPEGREIDHLCRNRSCVNPTHLEAVTRKVNQHRGVSFSGVNARKTHCPQGHPYDEINTYIHQRTGYRQCRTCRANRISVSKLGNCRSGDRTGRAGSPGTD